MPSKIRDIAWLGGLIEGEGSFMYKESESPTIAIQMTDQDIIRRVSSMFGSKARGPYVRTDGNKTTWACSVHGQKAIGWMMTLYTFLGQRRQEKIRDILQRWKTYVPPIRPNRFAGTPKYLVRSIPACHPEKRMGGNGLCRACYMRKWRADRMSAAVAQQLS